MKFAKLISALAIIMTVAIAPASRAFAQSNTASDGVNDKQNYKDERKQFFDSIKEQRKDLKDQIKDFKEQRKDKTFDSERIYDVEPTLKFDGITSGWAVVGGKAYPATFSLEGKAGQVSERGWQLSGIGTVEIEKRMITFELKGFTKNNHVNIKGISQTDESIVIHLRGTFASMAESDNSFALAFTRATIVDQNSDVKVPLVLTGEVKTNLLTPVVDETESKPEITESEIEELLDALI